MLAVNQFNEQPDPGMVYALVNATITYTGAESDFAASVGPIRPFLEPQEADAKPIEALHCLIDGSAARRSLV